MADEEGGFTIVTLADLRAVLDDLPPELSDFDNRFQITVYWIIRQFLGDEWLKKNVLNVVLNSKSTPHYFSILVGTGTATPEQSQKKFMRVFQFAEMLFNLQLVPGFHSKIESMKTAKPHEIESGMAEFEAAKILNWHEINFVFMPQGDKKNYDIEMYLAGLPIGLEVKCKLESTLPRAESIKDSLKKSLAQLPEDRPSSVFVKVPPEWFVGPNEISEDISRATFGFFNGGGTRVMSIIYFTPVPTVDKHQSGVTHLYKEVINLKCRFDKLSIELLDEQPSTGADWINLIDIIRGKK